MSKLSFRARALDASRPLAVWLAEELPELPDYSAISRAVPQMPSGMEKEEECEHHLQRAICTGLIIPTPEVSDAADLAFYERCYPPDYRMPRQLIHVQPLCLEQETPEYDMDSEDERWLRQQHYAELTELKFEEMMDRLERSSGQTVVTLNEAKLLLERRDDLVIAVYDYWLNKRLKTQHPLILSVRTESRAGQPANNPYLAFRRRTEKMQTRKNRKNDESSYEKMLKLRRDLSRAASLLELVARRERAKRDLVRLTALLAERRFHAGDFAGHLLAELAAATAATAAASAPVRAACGGSGGGGGGARRAFAGAPHAPRAPAAPPDARPSDRARADWRSARSRDKRQYKRRKHRHHGSSVSLALRESGAYSSSEEEALAAGAARGEARGDDAPAAPVDDGPFAFRRKAGVYYQMPTSSLCGDVSDGSLSPSSHKENSYVRDDKYRFTLTSISHPYPKCIGFARRRLGRGGRVILDRISTPLDDLWPHLDFAAEPPQHPPDERARHRYPHETTLDYRSGAKHPWRHVFRHHYRDDPAKWTRGDSADVKLSGDSVDVKPCGDSVDVKSCWDSVDVKACGGSVYVKLSGDSVDVKPCGDSVDVKPEEDFNDCNKLYSGDISYSEVEAGVRAGLARARKRARSRPSESSLDSAAELEPHEADFSRLLDQVNSEWLHFRPKTPPESPAEEDESDRSPLTADTPLAVELAHVGDSPFTTADFTLAELSSSGEAPLEPEDADLIGLTDAQVESILSDTELTAIADRSELLRPDDADALLAGLVGAEGPFLLSGQGGAGRVGAAASSDSGPRRDELGCSVVRVSPLPPPRILLEAPPPEPPPEPPPQPPPQPPERREEARPAQVKAPPTRPSPLKKHIVTSAQRRPEPAPPQLVTVAVSEGLKARLQAQPVPVPNGPAATVAGPARNDGVAPVVSASTSTPRRVSAPLLHLTPALHPKLQLSSAALASVPSVVVSHAGPNKLKVLHAHTLTHTQRAQLLAQSRALGAADGKPPPALAQFYEIRGPHLVNVVRPPQPSDARRRAQLVHRVSVLDGRQLVRAALPTVRAHHVRHQAITIAAPPKSLPGSLVANLLQKGAVAKSGQKIAIAAGGGGGGGANVQAFAAFTQAQQLKARQARLVTQPRTNAVVDVEAPTTSGAAAAAVAAAAVAAAAEGGGGGDADASTNGAPAVRPMEVT